MMKFPGKQLPFKLKESCTSFYSEHSQALFNISEDQIADSNAAYNNWVTNAIQSLYVGLHF